MKKKKFDGLSLNKNVISKLNGNYIKGGGVILVTGGCPSYNDCSANLPCLSGDCEVGTIECNKPSQQTCHSIHKACE
ncbi:class I lanthipeptide [uncultured Aquimarina sp.]|uniref:class I lanthipeptide n=1 Tax=uncultured Aquimarina sp. TaxID=575652 RepID=UPI0026323575|nr:class I lanthipeptide [uncultured Aquimarina sp.]